MQPTSAWLAEESQRGPDHIPPPPFLLSHHPLGLKPSRLHGSCVSPQDTECTGALFATSACDTQIAGKRAHQRGPCGRRSWHTHFQKMAPGTSLVVPWLRPCGSKARGMG